MKGITKKHLRIGGCAALGGLTIVLAGCAAYSGIVRQRCRTWEDRQSWGDDGVRVGCEPLEAGAGDTTLLMVHGFGDNPTVWKPMMESFAARGYHCRAMRLPGFGDTLEARKQIDSAGWGNALAAELRPLKREGRKVWLVAHSMGGAIAIRHALRYPRGIEGIVLLAPLLDVSKRRSPLLCARAWHRAFGHAVSVTESPFPEDLRKAPPADRTEVDRFITPNINDSLFALLDEIRPHADAIRVPVFLAISPHDRVADPAAAKAWFDKLSESPRRHLFIADNSAHVLPLDHDAGRLVKEIDAFIRASTGNP